MNGDVTGIYLGDDTSSDEHCRFIRRWLDNCEKVHHQCRNINIVDAAEPSLPTRCIDVRPDHPILADTARLKGHYLIISHRWSDETITSKTFLSNRESRKEGLTLGALPKLLQDAVSLARKLKVSYVWMDSICIIQDGGDWEVEAPRMSEYYTNALFTLILATSMNGGCFFERPRSIVGPIARLPYRDRAGVHKGFIYFHRRQQTPAQDYKSSVSMAHIFTRGWIFQERFLSRRRVYYTDGIMFLECPTGGPISEWNEEVPVDKAKNDGMSVARHSNNSGESNNGPERYLFTLNDWYERVSEYTTLDLTYPAKDCLVALSGVAQVFKESFEHQRLSGQNISYLDGLWYHDLSNGLLWEHTGDNEPKSSGCNAPTWSWAFYQTPVKWDAWSFKPGIQTQCKVNRISIQSSDIMNRTSAPLIEQTQESIASEDVFSRHNGETICCIEIKLPHRQVTIGEHISKNNVHKLAQWTEYAQGHTDDEDLGRNNWRAVYSSDNSNNRWIIGWASIGNPSVRHELATKGEVTLIAGCISSGRATRGSYAYGELFHWHKVCNIIYLQLIEGAIYKRAGSGRIFEKDFFKDAEETDITLV